MSWQPRFLGARCPGGGANPARWLRPFGTSKCLSACVPGLFLSRANLQGTLPQLSSCRLTLTVPKPLPGTAAQRKLVIPKCPCSAPPLRSGASSAPASAQRRDTRVPRPRETLILTASHGPQRASGVSAERATGVSLPSFNSRGWGRGVLSVACICWEIRMSTLLDQIKSLGAGE